MKTNVVTEEEIHVGERIKRLRGFRGMTCEELSDRIDRTRPYLSSVENGHNPPTKKLLRVIAEALDVDIGYFTGDSSIEAHRDELDRLFYYSHHRGERDGIERVEMMRLPLLDDDQLRGLSRSGDAVSYLADIQEFVSAPASLRAGGLFAYVMDDEAMEPRVRPGDTLVISANLEAKDGAPVIIVLSNGEVMCRIVEKRNHRFHFLPLNRAFPALMKPREEVAGVFAVMTIVSDFG